MSFYIFRLEIVKATTLIGFFKMRFKDLVILLSFCICIFLQSCANTEALYSKTRPENFIYVKDLIPDIQTDMRYAGRNNFVGRPIEGYERPVAILTSEAANALKKVQDELRPYGLYLCIYDAYRPQRAVNDFYRWAGDINDQKNKAKYYPDIDKRLLFKEGYIMNKSAHSRGSAVDLTILCKMPDGSFRELDMGSNFDLFSVKSWPDNSDVSPQHRANRLLLRTLMMKHGFVPYSKEWWHFSLEKEPYPTTYFDFPVK